MSGSHPKHTRVAVVTVSYGSGDVLPAFLESLPAATSGPVEVIVSDNKQDDNKVEALARAHGAKHLRMPDNVGYGSAVNAAVASLPAEIEWVLVANPDLVMAPGTIDTLVALGDSDPRIGAVGPATFEADGSIYPSARAIPSLRTGVGHALFSNLWHNNPWSKAYRSDIVTATSPRDAGWLSGSCVLVRRSLWDTLGGFDPDYFMYFEDVDLGYRIGKQGYRNVFQPAASVTHTRAHSTTGNAAAMVHAHHQSARRFLDKKYPGVLLWPVRFVLRIGLALRSAIVRRRSQD